MAESRRWIMTVGLTTTGVLFAGVVVVTVLVYRALAGPSWRTHRDAMGFTVELPSEGTLRADPASGRVEITPSAGETLVVWPLFAPGRIDDRAGPRFLAGVLRKLSPGSTWGRAERLAAGTWRMRGDSGGARRTGVLACVTTPKGTAGFIYLMAAPTRGAVDAEARFARILASFRLTGQAVTGQEKAPELRYVRWQDPREAAFTAELPEGWRVEGGTLRPTPLLVHAQVAAGSPDGEIALLAGDAFPVYAEPNATLAFAGLRAGDSYSDPMGHPTPIAHYVPGLEYALRAVVPQRVGGSFRVTHRANRPELARRLATVGINRFDAGEAEYRFNRRGREHRGWTLCITERVAAGAVTLWHVWRLYLVEAPAERFDEGSTALVRLATTFRIDPGWAQRQARLTAAQSRIISDMGEATSRTIAEGFENRQQTLDEIHRRGANARREIDVVVDSHTDRGFTVTSGSDYYWVDDRGTVLGTDTDTRPSVDFRELTRLP
jgi:hypothetical protein